MTKAELDKRFAEDAARIAELEKKIEELGAEKAEELEGRGR